MLTETFQTLAHGARQTLKNWKTTLLLMVLYAGLLASIYLLLTTREATLPQVALTFALALVIPLLFFALQTLGASSQSTLRKYAADLLKVGLVSLPVILIGVISFYLLSKAQNRIAPPTKTNAEQQYNVHAMATEASQMPDRPVKWDVAIFNCFRYLLFLLLMPLLLIHLWIATVQEGLWPTIRRLKDQLRQTCSPSSVLIYMCGFVVFAVIPYLLLFKDISAERAWLDFSIFAARLALVFTLTLFGWLVTMKALALLQQKSRRVVQ